MPFFEQFPRVKYDFNRKGVQQNMVDLFRSVRPLPTFLDEYSAYSYFNVQNGERPDVVSERIYGTSDYYWTFFIVNEHLHDGYRAWPLSQEDMYDYLAKQYEGYVITTDPVIVRNTDGLITDHQDSLAGRFQIGETVTGSVSGASGKLTRKNIDMNQLIVQNVTGGAFIGDPDLVNQATELVVGQTSNDSVSTHTVYKYADAPYYYYLETDTDKKPVTNGLHVVGGVDASDLSYVTYRTYEYEKNDERSKIRYVVPNYIEQFVDAFEELINV